MTKIKTAIIGAAGYTGAELVRLLVHHPACELVCLYSSSQKGKRIDELHGDLIGDCDLLFTDVVPHSGLDAVFLCLPHGEATSCLKQHSFSDTTVLIDLSTDFRNESAGFVYGLPEVNAHKVKTAKRIANPGCFATAIQLALAPAIQKNWVQGPIHVTGITGSTGAGKSLTETSHFSYRTNNLSVYKLFNHQHLQEIKQTFQQLNPEAKEEILFVPYRGNFSRGIWITAYFPFTGTTEMAINYYKEFYSQAVFTHVTEGELDLKKVINTNKCLLSLQVQNGQLIIYSAVDNLLKGASGQAVQNFNLAFGLEEKMGLNLKSVVY